MSQCVGNPKAYGSVFNESMQLQKLSVTL